LNDYVYKHLKDQISGIIIYDKKHFMTQNLLESMIPSCLPLRALPLNF